MLSFFPIDVLDEIWDVIESVSEGFLTYSSNSAMLDFVTGSHTVEAYSSCGRTMDSLHLAYTSFGQLERFLRRKATLKNSLSEII